MVSTGVGELCARRVVVRKQGGSAWVMGAVLLATAAAIGLESWGQSVPVDAKIASPGATDKAIDQIAPRHGPMRGFCIQLSNPNGTDAYIKAIDDLADMGCTWINFSIAARQETVKSNYVKIVWQNIPSQKDIERILLHARQRHVRTMLISAQCCIVGRLIRRDAFMPVV